jgi:hypothetical protein
VRLSFWDCGAQQRASAAAAAHDKSCDKISAPKSAWKLACSHIKWPGSCSPISEIRAAFSAFLFGSGQPDERSVEFMAIQIPRSRILMHPALPLAPSSIIITQGGE